jgi:cytochrome c oxidase subunit 2
MNLPIDKPVIVYLSSQDVIHSMGIAEMRVKQDAVPGIQIPVWWVPNELGQFEVNCSQLCGLGHYRMRGFVTVMEQADYDAWLAEEASFLTGN